MPRSAAQRRAWSKLPRHVKRHIRSQPLSVWAKRIKREFGHECAMCQTTESLEAHHIYFKSLYPSRIEDLDNGICLCTKCHDKAHSLYIESPTAHYDLINVLNIKREKMKSISLKARNPSTQGYPTYEVIPLEEITEVVVENERVLGKKKEGKTLLKKSKPEKPAKAASPAKTTRPASPAKDATPTPKKRGRPAKLKPDV